jgi:peptidase A4-like protein
MTSVFSTLGPVAVLVAAACAAVCNADAATSTSVVNPNWAGYVATPHADVPAVFTRVAGTWREPRVVCSPGDAGAAAAIWVGIGGYGGSAELEQVGNTVGCGKRDQPVATVWFDLYPYPAHAISLKVRPGDTLTGAVTVSSAAVGLELTDAALAVRTNDRLAIERREIGRVDRRGALYLCAHGLRAGPAGRLRLAHLHAGQRKREHRQRNLALPCLDGDTGSAESGRAVASAPERRHAVRRERRIRRHSGCVRERARRGRLDLHRHLARRHGRPPAAGERGLSRALRCGLAPLCDHALGGASSRSYLFTFAQITHGRTIKS